MKYTETSNVFIDSNLWIYLSVETNDTSKHEKATHFFERIANKNIFVSIQVINEFHWVLLKKYKLPKALINEKVTNGIIPMSNILPLKLAAYQKANQIRIHYSVSFWDSLIISSALLADCSILYTEDMQNGLVLENQIKIINPFLSQWPSGLFLTNFS